LPFVSVLLPNSHAPSIERLISFYQEDDESIIWNFLGKGWMFPHETIKLHANSNILYFKSVHSSFCIRLVAG